MIVANRLEVGVLHGILGCHTFSMVIPEHLAQQVERLVRHKLIVLRVDEFAPWFVRDRVLWQNVLIVRVKRQSVLVQVLVEFLSAQDFCNLDELVIVVATLEEGLSLEDHAGEHAPKRPNVQTVVVSLQVDEQLGSFEVAGRHAHIVLLSRMVELSKTPIDQT